VGQQHPAVAGEDGGERQIGQAYEAGVLLEQGRLGLVGGYP
jgi:hypothetical protein